MVRQRCRKGHHTCLVGPKYRSGIPCHSEPRCRTACNFRMCCRRQCSSKPPQSSRLRCDTGIRQWDHSTTRSMLRCSRCSCRNRSSHRYGIRVHNDWIGS
jgi:hypothetical protein